MAIAAACVAAGIILAFMPPMGRARDSVLAAAALAYFSSVHSSRNAGQFPLRWARSFPGKEFLVGVLFTAGCVLPAWHRPNALAAPVSTIWTFWIPAVYFAALAWLNCSCIAEWESMNEPQEARQSSAMRVIVERAPKLPATFYASILLACGGLFSAAVGASGASAIRRSTRCGGHERFAAGAARPNACSHDAPRVARRGGFGSAHAARADSGRRASSMNPSLPLPSSKTQRPGAPEPALSLPNGLDFETWDRIGPSATRSAAPNFDGLARIYRSMELATFGSWLERCRFAFLRDLAECRRGAVLGDGDGRFTAQLLQANLTIEIDAVDSSAAMLRALPRRAGHNAARVRLHRADARTWQPAKPPYDLVATHFFLDCLTEDEVCSLAHRLRGALSPSGLWLVSEFAIPEGAFGKWAARPAIWLLYRAFGLLTGLTVRKLPDYASALRAAGFTLRQRRSFLNGLLVAEIWATA